MERYSYPHTIDNGSGEQITFVKYVKDETGDYLEVENTVAPNAGPPMHVHWKQEESLTVFQGTIGVQILGEGEQFFEVGQTATFKAGVPHRFWNAGTEPLICKGYIKPADNIEYFLTEIFQSTKANGGERPGLFDSAYLTTKYKSEFEMSEIPAFVKKVIFPVVVFLGTLLGKYGKYKDAPEAVK